MIFIKILIITGQEAYGIIKKIVEPLKDYVFDIVKAPVSVSAFITEKMVRKILKSISLNQFDLILLPGFVQWDARPLEEEFGVNVKKGPEFASDIPMIVKNLDKINLSSKVPANKLFRISGKELYEKFYEEQVKIARENLGSHTFYINEERSEIIIGRNLPPPIIAEIVNCTLKEDEIILKKAKHYMDSGAGIIDIGCVSNRPDPERIKEIIKLLRRNFDVLISIDSMNPIEINSAVDEGIDLILSLDLGNYKECSAIPKDTPIVILPTNVSKGYFPSDADIKTRNLFSLIKKLREMGNQKLIADPLLQTPISPGMCNSLESYFLYKKRVSQCGYSEFEVPLFFGVSNVVELMDVDSVGINGLLASLAIELDIGILFTVEHSTKLMGGVKELSDCVKLCYISKHQSTPPINVGIEVFKAKGKTSEELPIINRKNAIHVSKLDESYVPDPKGYFKFHVNHYSKEIYVLFFSNKNELKRTLIGNNAEALCKRILQENLITDPYHVSYISRELSKAETCLKLGKPYLQEY
ncbi:MAG: dihydropteroate synthase-like protein [Promethearchaeota archaeon]